MTKNKGITIVALVITIIVLLILAGITISALTDNGLISNAIKAKKETEKAQTKGQLENVLLEASIQKATNEKYNSEDFLDEFIKEKIKKSKIEEDNVIIDKYSFLIDREALKIISVEDYQKDTKEKNSLIAEIEKIKKSSYSTIEVTGKDEQGTEEKVNYNLHTIVYNQDLVLDGINSVDGATLSDNIYEFGNKETDVATDSEDAKNTVVLKVNGNLVINEGVTLTACKSDDGYGGPKGLMIYCTGTITNNGTISMTARGARAEGENVYLYENNNNTFEYIPAQGAKGGESLRKGRNSGGNGINGYAGSKRQTGGGGSGAVWASDENPIAISGAGGTGTSYSGGAGGGGCNQNSGLTIQAEDGSSTGGKGGNGRGYRASSSWATRLAGGGAGNPGGIGGQNGFGNAQDGTGENGTGGLLVIYSNNVDNKGKIESNGSKGTVYTDIGGGSSGGGSINIFYKNNISCTGSLEAKGGDIGTNSSGSKSGSNGGDGTISIGSVKNGTYLSDTGDFKIKENSQELIKIANESVIGNNGNKVENKLEYNLEIEEKPNTAQIVWESSDENIVTVDQNRKIKYVNPGTVTITCTAKTKIGTEYKQICEVIAEERLYLYYYGNMFENLTGGYEQCARSGRRYYATINNDNVYIDCNANAGGGGIYTVNSIDLTPYKRLKSIGKVTGWATSDSAGRIMATTTNKTWGSAYYPSGYKTFSYTDKTTEQLTLTHDITELNTSYYICNGFNQSYGNIYEIWLEK